MKTDQYWKQFAGSGIGSGHNMFFKARLKLTALYVLIVAIIVFGFSLFLYQSIGSNLRDASDDDFAGAGSHQHFTQNTLGEFGNNILLADIVILVVSAGLSFALAGKTLQPIRLSVEAQKAFAANASHELRTPLAVMRNDIEVFLRNPSQTKEFTQETMHRNLDEISHMSSLVEDLLVLARSDNHVVLKYDDIDLNVIVENCVHRMRSLADMKKVKISYTAIGQSNLQGSETQLQRMVLNILQNSIDHTLSGGSITLALKKEGSQYHLSICDTGVGIPLKDLPNIFQRFYKGDSARGTGLGLSIVKEIVDQHKGIVSVESVEGKGTTFVVKLPISLA